MKTITEDTRCVWMTSNVIDYKLCDKHFECEQCEFDRVMRHSANSSKTASSNGKPAEEIDKIDLLLDGLMYEHHHERSIYLPNNLVLDELADQTFRLSLSSIAVHFLDNVFTVVPGRLGSEIRKGQPCLMLSGAWGGMTVNSPINFLYQDKSDDALHHDKGQWVIGIIQAEKNEIARECLSPQEWQQQIIELSRMLIQNKMRRSQEGGQTVMDCGHIVKYLYQRIGKENYLDVLNFFFKQKIKNRGV